MLYNHFMLIVLRLFYYYFIRTIVLSVCTIVCALYACLVPSEVRESTGPL